MKKTITSFTIVLALITICTVLIGKKTGTEAGYAGDKASNFENCTYCHNDGAAITQAGMITSNIPSSGYVIDSTYAITATISYAGFSKFGFEISPQDSIGNLVGTMYIGNSDMQLVPGSSGKYITHTLAGNSGTNTRSWTFNWKAPSTGKGKVTFYGAFNAGDGDNTDQGDNIFLSTLIANDASMPVGLSVTSTQSNGCNNANNGTATVTASGGTPPYTYLWAPSGGNAATAIGLAPNTYTCTITDSHLPTANTINKTITIANPPALIASIGAKTNVLCKGKNTGAATVTVNGGTGTKTFVWAPTGGTGAIATGLVAGTYTVTITDENNCTTTATELITEPATALTASPTAASGKANANASGGTPPYTYLWSPSGGTADTASGLTAGTYTVTVTDKNGCTVSKTVQIFTGITGCDNSQSSIKIFPNPCNGVFSIEIIASTKQDNKIKIFDAIGKEVFCESFELETGKNILPIVLPDFNNGVFYLNITTNEGIRNIPLYTIRQNK